MICPGHLAKLEMCTDRGPWVITIGAVNGFIIITPFDHLLYRVTGRWSSDSLLKKKFPLFFLLFSFHLLIYHGDNRYTAQ